MTDWLKKVYADPNADVACSLALTCNWYESELKEAKRTKALLKQLKSVRSNGENNDPAEVCQVLDTIKEKVPVKLRNRLFDFDCATQSFAAEC